MDRYLVEFFYWIFLICIAVKDVKEKIIPDKFTLGIIFLGFIKIFFQSESFEKSFLGMGVYPVPFIIIYGYISSFFEKEFVGFGDIKLLGALGFYKGYTGIFDIIFIYNTVFILGFVFSLFYILLNKRKKDSQIPFAPFIISGFLIFDLLGNVYEKI